MGIEGNECADIHAEEARNLDQSNIVTSEDANMIVTRQIFRKPFVPELNYPKTCHLL